MGRRKRELELGKLTADHRPAGTLRPTPAIVCGHGAPLQADAHPVPARPGAPAAPRRRLSRCRRATKALVILVPLLGWNAVAAGDAPLLAPGAGQQVQTLQAEVRPGLAGQPSRGTTTTGSPTVTSSGGPPPAARLSDAVFTQRLASSQLAPLEALCPEALTDRDPSRLQRLRQRLFTLLPPPQPLAPLIANAEALRRCGAPLLALQVLDRLSPAPGADRQIWLIAQWRLAASVLDHDRARRALERLAPGQRARLDTILLPVDESPSAQRRRWSALDALADHLEALGQPTQAAAVLLLVPQPGISGAQRLQTAARLLQTGALTSSTGDHQGTGLQQGAEQRHQLRERALQLAATAGAWGLVLELLDEQIQDPGADASRVALARARRLRLSPRLDDAYGEALLRPPSPAFPGAPQP